MTDEAPRLVDFAAHPGDYLTSPSKWSIREGFSEGTKFVLTSHNTHVYSPGGAIERVIGSVRATRVDANFVALIAAPNSTLTEEWQWGPAEQTTWDSTQYDFDIQAGDGGWNSSTRYAPNLYLAWQRINTQVTIGADSALFWSNLAVFHRRYNYAGGLVNTITTPTLTVRGVVHDLMGRGFSSLVEFDQNRVADGTAWNTVVDHAAWWDGVSAREVLEFCVAKAPGMWWGIFEPGPSGLPKFEIGRWDGPVRYVIDPSVADVKLSGGTGDLANRALVRYVGVIFKKAKTIWVAEVRANIKGLSESGIDRTMMVDLTGEGLMTPEDARIRGLAALAKAAKAKTAGSVTVSGPILDLIEGRMVEPWEVRGGAAAYIADATSSFSRAPSTAAVGADGESIFRIQAVSYDISSNSATLSLDGGERSLIGRFRTEAADRRYDVGSSRL